MKFGPLSKHDKKNGDVKKIGDDVMSEIVMPLSFFRCMVDLEQSGSWIPDAWSMIFIFLSITTFHLTKA